MEIKHMKRYSTSLVFKEMQVKHTMRSYYIPIRMANIKSTDIIRVWQGCTITVTLIYCSWKYEMVKISEQTPHQEDTQMANKHVIVQPLWKTVGIFLLSSTYPYHKTQQSYS